MRQEVDEFLEEYPRVTMFEALITDCNGVARGKWIPRSKIYTVLEDGLKLPQSALGLDIWGRDTPRLSYDNGDIDGYCHVIEGSLRPILGERGVDQGQLLMTMLCDQDRPFMGDPRQVLARVLSTFEAQQLLPCVAAELEFSLLPDPGHGRPLREALVDRENLGGNLYALDELDRHAKMLEALREAFEIQGLPYEGIVKEAAPAQFEINMAHSTDVLALADQIIRMQRGIRTIASRFGMIASFMPKPMDDTAGNGMHVHCSVLDQNGHNIFDSGDDRGSERLGHALWGCMDLMADSMLIFAPSFNAYRRFQAGNHAPTVATWGYDNRTTALRIPAGPTAATRIEHRVAGADANPYLALAAVLTGIAHGLEQRQSPPPPVAGNAWAMEHDLPPLPTLMDLAIDRFMHSERLAHYLSAPFIDIFTESKQQELDEFRRRVTDLELETYLRG